MSIGAAVLTFREGLEAALIIAILLGYLVRIGEAHRARAVWAGVGLAVALTVLFVGLLQAIGARFDYPAKGVYEGITSLLAVAMVTYMTFWFALQGRGLKRQLESSAHEVLGRGSVLGLAALAFTTVIREGVETALFLSASIFASSSAATLVGGLVGLAAAVAVAALVYAGGRRVNLGLFFRGTGVLLVVFGAAMLRYAVHEFEEVGLLPPLVEMIWNTSWLVPEGTIVGSILQALVGYESKPSLLQVLVVSAYYATVGTLLFRTWRRPVALPGSTGSGSAQQVPA